MKVLKEYSIIRFLKNVQIKKKSCRIVVNNLELSLFEKQVHGTGESFQRKNQVTSLLTGGPQGCLIRLKLLSMRSKIWKMLSPK